MGKVNLPDVMAKVDLVIQSTSALQVIDFKTSRSRWNEEKAREAGDQLVLYGLTVSRIIAVWQTGLWRWVPGQGEVNRETINQALRQAQRSLEQPLTQEMKTRSRNHAEAVVDGFLKTLGWRIHTTTGTSDS